MADSPRHASNLESTVADIILSATGLLSGSVRPDEAAINRVTEVCAATRGVHAVRRTRVHRGQHDESVGRFRTDSRILHRVRLPATGDVLEVELASRDDPEWADEDQVWRLHSVLVLLTAATTAPPGTDSVEQLLWHARSIVAQLERNQWSIRSSACTRVLGYAPDVSRYETPLSLVDPRDRVTALRAYVETFSGRRQSRTIDLRMLHADGSYRVLETTFVNLPGGGGRRTVALYAVDSTAQRADTARLRALVHHLDGGVLVVEENDHVRLVNDAFVRLFGTVVGGWPGQSQRQAMRAVIAACPNDVTTIERLSRLVRAHKHLVERIDLADGRIIDLHRTPVFEHGLHLGALWQFRDVTANVTAGTAQRSVDVSAERSTTVVSPAAPATVPATRTAAGAVAPPGTAAAAAVGDPWIEPALAKQNQMLATVSHELRTPLTAVMSFADMLAETGRDNLSDTQRAATEVISRNTRRLLTLVDDLLLLSRLEDTRLPLRHGPIDMPALVSAAVTDRRLEAAEAEIRLIGESSEGPALTGDASRLNQVLGNLIRNAMKFSARGSTVKVVAHHDGPKWTISVVDHGMGIPGTELERITRGFERGSNALAAGIPGSGLGLAICRELVDLHHGTMSITSTLNEGTEVRISLPVGEGGR